MSTDPSALTEPADPHESERTKSSVRRWVERRYSHFQRFARQQARDEGRGDDAAHSAFGRLLGESGSSLARLPRLTLWTAQVIMNRIADPFRKRKREQPLDVSRRAASSVDDPAAVLEEGEKALEREREEALYREAISQFREEDRELIALRIEQRLTHTEVGVKLGITEAAAAKRWEVLNKLLKGSTARLKVAHDRGLEPGSLQYRVLCMYYLRRMSVEAITGALGCTRRGAEHHLKTIRARLPEELRERD